MYGFSAVYCLLDEDCIPPTLKIATKMWLKAVTYYLSFHGNNAEFQECLEY